MPINYFNEDLEFKLTSKLKLKSWVKNSIEEEGNKLGTINYIFCTDDYLLKVNQEYLNHDYYTDFITFDTSDKEFKSLKKFEEYFNDYGVSFLQGGSGADIGPLKDGDIILAGLRPDPQRYFDYHHAASDTFDKINKRELELGAAAMASIVYLMDNYKL